MEVFLIGHGNVTLYVIPPEQIGALHMQPLALLAVKLLPDSVAELRETGKVGRIATTPLGEKSMVCIGPVKRFRCSEGRMLPTMSREDALHLVADHHDGFCASTVKYLDHAPAGVLVVADWPGDC